MARAERRAGRGGPQGVGAGQAGQVGAGPADLGEIGALRALGPEQLHQGRLGVDRLVIVLQIQVIDAGALKGDRAGEVGRVHLDARRQGLRLGAGQEHRGRDRAGGQTRMGQLSRGLGLLGRRFAFALGRLHHEKLVDEDQGEGADHEDHGVAVGLLRRRHGRSYANGKAGRIRSGFSWTLGAALGRAPGRKRRRRFRLRALSARFSYRQANGARGATARRCGR